MRILRNPVFVVAAILFWLKYGLEYFQLVPIPVIFAYLDDVLALPVILTLTVGVQRQWVYRNRDYVLSKTQIIFAVLYLSLLFEGILPAFSYKYTRDGWDVAAYILGTWLFYRFINRPESVHLRT